MKNGFTKHQNTLISEVRKAIKEGATLDACAVIIAANHDSTEQYVKDTYNSFIHMKVYA